MTSWIPLIPQHAWRQLVMTLLHTLWQGGIIAILVYFVLKRVAAIRTSLRYGTAVTGLLAVVACGLITASLLKLPARKSVVVQTISAEQAPVVSDAALSM